MPDTPEPADPAPGRSGLVGARRGPAYSIRTARLLLRCFAPTDALALSAAICESLEHLRPWMPWVKAEPLGVEARVQYLRTQRGNFDLDRDYVYGIFDPARPERPGAGLAAERVLGGIGLHTRLGSNSAREIGYWIHADHAGRGLTTEAAAAVVRAGFEIDRLERIEIHCDPANVRSARVPAKLGFTLDGTLRRRCSHAPGEAHDSMVWSLFADEYPRSPAAAAVIEAFDARGLRIL